MTKLTLQQEQGLVCIYNDLEHLESGSGLRISPDRIVDIIAVHGLGAHRDYAWIRKKGSYTGLSKDVNWLTDLLPHTLHESNVLARIHCFNYTSKWLGKDLARTRLLSIAEQLLDSTRSLSTSNGTQRHPIILIGHSYGGLVIEQSIIRLNGQQYRYPYLLDSIRGIVLLGTPHRGSSAQSIGSMIAKTAQAIRWGESSLIDDINEESMSTHDLIADFSTIIIQKDLAKSDAVVCFFENLPTDYGRRLGGLVPLKYLIVPETSAVISGISPVMLNSDHFKLNKFGSLDDPNYKSVSSHLSRIARKALDLDSIYYNQNIKYLPFARNEDFVPRERISTQLEELLGDSQKRQAAAIWGLGGSGKTQIALEFAYYHLRKPRACALWIPSNNESKFVQGYQDVAKLVGISTELKGDDLLHAVRLWIEEQDNCLLILDNADHVSLFKKLIDQECHGRELFQFLPRGSRGSFLWTSRDGNIVGSLVGPQEGINVRGMEPEEALPLFLHRSGHTTSTAHVLTAKQLVTDLEFLPLAIVQAASFIKSTGTRIEDYADRFHLEEDRAEMLSQEFIDRHRMEGVPNSIMRTCLISVRQIAETNTLAENTLYIIGYLDSQNISTEFLEAAASSATISAPSWVDTRKAIGQLEAFSFLQKDATAEGSNFYSLHPLVQFSVRRFLDSRKKEDGLEDFAECALTLVNRFFPSGKFDTWTRCKLYLPHLLSVCKLNAKNSHRLLKIDMLSRAALYLIDNGQSVEAEDLQIEVVELLKEELGVRHPQTLNSMTSLAVIRQHQGRFKEAENSLKEALELQLQDLESNPEALQTMAGLAANYHEQGRFREAEELKIKVLSLRKEILGPHNPDTLSSMASLASTYFKQGQLKEAESLETDVLKLRKEILGPLNPETLTSMFNLAATYYEEGLFKKSEELSKEALKLRKEVLGMSHPYTLNSMASLAATFREQGQLKEAEELLIEVLKLQKQKLGLRHPGTPYTLSSLTGLAVTYREQGKSKEAEDLEIEVLNLRKELLGLRHPDTLPSMAKLAMTFSQQGRLKEAEELGEETLRLRKEVIGPRHPDTLESMVHLAIIYVQEGHLSKAEELATKAFKIQNEDLGPRHPDTLSCMVNLTAIYCRQGQLRKAEGIGRKSLMLQKEVLGLRHPDTLDCMSNLAYIYGELGQETQQAELLLQLLGFEGDKN